MNTERRTVPVRNTLNLPGNLYPMECNRYPEYLWAAQSEVQQMLRINYCENLGLPPIDQIEIVNGVSESLTKSIGPAFAVVFTRSFGLEAAGYGEYGFSNMLRDEGMPSSHNIPTNDTDIFVLTSDNTGEPHILETISEGMASGAEKMLVHPSVRHHTPYTIETSAPNAWNMPQYLKFKMRHFRQETPLTTLEFHHEPLLNGSIDRFLNRYQIVRSNLIGSPMCVGFPDNTGKLSYFIWQPFSTESAYKDTHTVSLSSPESFGNTAFCIPQTARIPLEIIRQSIATGVPATLDPRSREIMRRGVEKHGPNLTALQQDKARKQMETTLFIAHRLQQQTRPSYLNHKLGDFKELVRNELDSVQWRENVLAR